MPTARALRPAALVAAALAFAPAASAGPLEFRLQSHTHLDDSHPVWAGAFVGGLPLDQSFAVDPSVGVTLQLAHFSPSYVRPADPDWQPMTSSVFAGELDLRAEVTITDEASGQSGTVTFGGLVWEEWAHRWDGTWNYTHGMSGFDDQTLMLGGTRYTLNATIREGDRLATLDITAGPAVPEPGTLALAAVGLGPVGLRLVRRRPTVAGGPPRG